MRRIRTGGLALVVVIATSGCAWVGRVGVSTAGNQPGGGSIVATDLSPDGRYAVFTSSATNLVANDTNNATDVFLHDNQAKTTERISITDAEAQSALGGYQGLVSANGRYVAFASDSEDLIIGDTNLSTDGFVRDRQLGTTVRVSRRNGGGQGNGASYLQAMTPDGRFILFASDADNLIGLLDQNFSTDVYLRDTFGLGTTTRVSVATDGTEGDLDSFGGSISDDGRYVAFVSNASNFDINDSGIYTDVFVRDRIAVTTTRITGFADGTEGDLDSTNVVISGNGAVVAFDSDASNLVATPDTNQTSDVYAAPVAGGTIERISVNNTGGDSDNYSFVTGLSDNGRFVLFQSGATNLANLAVTAFSNSYLRDRTAGSTALAGTTSRMGEPSSLDPAVAGSTPGAISGDGRYIAFTSSASDVTPTDTNGTVPDLYQRSNPVPFLLFASPTTIARGASGTISLHGASLHPGSLVLMGDGVAVTGTTFVSDTQVDVAVTVAADAEVGPHMPFIVDNGTGAGALTGGLAFLPGAFSVT